MFQLSRLFVKRGEYITSCVCLQLLLLSIVGIYLKNTLLNRENIPITENSEKTGIWHEKNYMLNYRRCSKWPPLTSRYYWLNNFLFTGMAAHDCSGIYLIAWSAAVLYSALNSSSNPTSKYEVVLRWTWRYPILLRPVHRSEKLPSRLALPSGWKLGVRSRW